MIKRVWYTLLIAEEMGENEEDIKVYVETLTDEKIDNYYENLPKVNGHPIIEELWVIKRDPNGNLLDPMAVKYENVRADEALIRIYEQLDDGGRSSCS